MAVHKCKKCIWSNKISNNLVYCIFPKCIIKEKALELDNNSNERVVKPTARTSCNIKRKRSMRNVSKKTKKTL